MNDKVGLVEKLEIPIDKIKAVEQTTTPISMHDYLIVLSKPSAIDILHHLSINPNGRLHSKGIESGEIREYLLVKDLKPPYIWALVDAGLRV